MEKNAKIGLFFYKEQKRTQRSERSFEKNGCPTLVICIVRYNGSCLDSGHSVGYCDGTSSLSYSNYSWMQLTV